MTVFEPVLLRYLRVPEATRIDFYLSQGGYEQARRALTGGLKPAEVTELVKASGLRGRGGAGFPCGVKWGFIPQDSPKPRYLVCNADESEPGTFKDRVLMETNPHELIEGIMLASYAIGAHTAYIYIRGEFGLAFRILRESLKQAYEKGFLGRRPFGSDFELNVHLHRGAGAYICGEETGLLSSLEGRRGYPRIKPPFPAVEGLFGCPTIINNVETLMTVVEIVRHGPQWFRQWGTEKSPGFRVYCVSGHVRRPGVYELPLGITARELVFEHAGGPPEGRQVKGVVPGGASAGILRADELDTPLDFESLGAKGLIAGTGAVVVLDDTTCMVDALWNTMRFYHHESCGQCTPCREGTGWIEKVVAQIEKGHGRREMLDLLVEVADNMCGRTICAFADGAAIPVRAFVGRFRAEFERHIEERGCPFRKPEAGVFR